MFNNHRYCTSGIAERVPLYTQVILWGLIDNMNAEAIDSFQIFRLSGCGDLQRIIHEQEIPEYKMEYTFKLCDARPVTGKIYVIDNSKYSTMLFADEY